MAVIKKWKFATSPSNQVPDFQILYRDPTTSLCIYMFAKKTMLHFAFRKVSNFTKACNGT